MTGSGQLPGAVQHPLKHLIKLKALVDAQRGITKPRQPLTKRLHLAPHIASPAHRATPATQPTSCPSARRNLPNQKTHSNVIAQIAKPIEESYTGPGAAKSSAAVGDLVKAPDQTLEVDEIAGL